MHWYKMCSDLTTGTPKYYSLTEYQNMLPFERNLFVDMIIERNNKLASGPKVQDDEIISDFESM